MESDSSQKPSGSDANGDNLITTSSVVVAEHSILNMALSSSDAALVKRRYYNDYNITNCRRFCQSFLNYSGFGFISSPRDAVHPRY